MHDMSNFYDILDLKYPEIGIAMQDIDCSNPGTVKMIIPILTPNMDNSKLNQHTVYQNNTNHLKNKNKNLDIKNIKISNYIEVPFPKEICYNVDGVIEKGSKWIIVFVGGDVTKPRPIARYIDDDNSEEEEFWRGLRGELIKK